MGTPPMVMDAVLHVLARVHAAHWTHQAPLHATNVGMVSGNLVSQRTVMTETPTMEMDVPATAPLRPIMTAAMLLTDCQRAHLSVEMETGSMELSNVMTGTPLMVMDVRQLAPLSQGTHAQEQVATPPCHPVPLCVEMVFWSQPLKLAMMETPMTRMGARTHALSRICTPV